MSTKTKEFEEYKSIIAFVYNKGLKSWVNENNFRNLYKESWEVLIELLDAINNKASIKSILDAGFNVTSEGELLTTIDMEECYKKALKVIELTMNGND